MHPLNDAVQRNNFEVISQADRFAPRDPDDEGKEEDDDDVDVSSIIAKRLREYLRKDAVTKSINRNIKKMGGKHAI